MKYLRLISDTSEIVTQEYDVIYYNETTQSVDVKNGVTPTPQVPSNEIWYTSTDGNIVNLFDTEEITKAYTLVSNTYSDGVGKMVFENDITMMGYDEENNVLYPTFIILEGDSNLKSVTIPNSVTTIGNSAFNNCTSLTSVTIPNSVTTIGEIAFEGCTSLSSVTIPDSVTSIGYNTFADCTSLSSVTIPSGVTSIGFEAFYNCTSLTTMIVEATIPPMLDGNSIPSNVVSVKVPSESVDAYKSAEGWSEYADKITAI